MSASLVGSEMCIRDRVTQHALHDSVAEGGIVRRMGGLVRASGGQGRFGGLCQCLRCLRLGCVGAPRFGRQEMALSMLAVPLHFLRGEAL
eukprot:7150052-Alexandrium_andersonii.AAC.1